MDVAAKLGIIVDAEGARREIKLTTDQLKVLADGGSAATTMLKGLSGGMTQAGAQAENTSKKTNSLTESINRMRQASAKKLDLGLAAQIQQMDPFQLGLNKGAVAAEKHSFATSKVSRALEGMIVASTGANAHLGTLSVAMSDMALGTGLITGVLAGIAALAFAYDKLTESARKAHEEQDKAIQFLTERFRPETGKGSAVNDAYDQAIKRQQEDAQKIKILQSTNSDLVASTRMVAAGFTAPFHNRQDEIDRLTKDLAAANLAIGRTRAQGAGKLEAVTTTDDSAERGRRAAEDAKQYANAIDQANKASNDMAFAQARGTLSVERQKDDALALRDAIMKSKAEYDKVNDAIEVRNQLEQAGIGIFDARYDAAKRDLEIAQRAKRETTEKVDADKKASDDAIAAQKKAADAADRIQENFVRSMQENFSNFFVDTFNQGFSSFQKLFGSIRDLYFKMIADILAAKVMDKLGGVLGVGSPSTTMNTAATKQVAAGAVMLNASGAMVAAANIMAGAAGVPGMGGGGVPAGGGAPGGGGGAFGGLGWGRAAGAGVAGGVVGYQIGSMTTNRAYGALGGAAGGAAAGFAVGGPVGAAIGAVTGFVGGIIGSGKAAKEAAKQMKTLQDQLKLTMDQFRAEVAGDNLALQIAQAKAALVSLLLQINAALPGKANEAERNRTRAEAQSLEAKQEQQIRDADAQRKKEAKEDLQVRMLRAQGRDQEADALALQLQQQREYAQAVKDGADAVYLATLTQVQAAEKIKAAQDAATSSALNMVSGYKLQATIFSAMAAHGAGGSGSGLRFLGAPQPTMAGGDLTVNVVVDGKAIGQAVLTNFKAKAQKKFGDSARWPEIQS